jgi:hypothetical protein
MSVTIRLANVARLSGVAALSACLLTGCGGGGSSPKATGTSGTAAAAGTSGVAASGAALAAAESNGANALAAVSGLVDVSKQCEAIPTADVQALLKSPPGDQVHNPLECDWKNTTLKVDLSPNDTDKKSYNDLLSTEGHAITGLGDVAQWSEPVPGRTAPDINAHKGNLTCYVQAADPITTLTLPYTGSDPFFKVTDADSLAYATLEAKLCADIFGVS